MSATVVIDYPGQVGLPGSLPGCCPGQNSPDLRIARVPGSCTTDSTKDTPSHTHSRLTYVRDVPLDQEARRVLTRVPGQTITPRHRLTCVNTPAQVATRIRALPGQSAPAGSIQAALATTTRQPPNQPNPEQARRAVNRVFQPPTTTNPQEHR